MQEVFRNLSKRQKVGIVSFLFLVLLIIVVSIFFMNDRDDGAPMTRIWNIDEYLTNATKEEKDVLQRSLYSFLGNNFEIDASGLVAEIRSGAFEEEQVGEAYIANFILDIDELKASYLTSYVFPLENATSVNPVFDCPEISEMKYPETKCVGMYNSSRIRQLEAENPINAVLPISVDIFDTYSRQSIVYHIYGVVDVENDRFVVRIIDYSGGNYERALNSIKEKGFNPEDYTIEYISYSDID